MKHLTTKELRQILDATHDDVIQFKDVKDKEYKAKGLYIEHSLVSDSDKIITILIDEV
jgi:hypothetical protein